MMARSCISDSMSSGSSVVAGRRTEAEMKRCHTAAPLDLLSLRGSLAAKAPGAAVVDFLVAPGVPAGRGGQKRPTSVSAGSAGSSLEPSCFLRLWDQQLDDAACVVVEGRHARDLEAALLATQEGLQYQPVLDHVGIGARRNQVRVELKGDRIGGDGRFLVTFGLVDGADLVVGSSVERREFED